jgi:lysozyme
VKAGDKAFELIKKWEGCKLKAYLCPAGKWTIGYGATGEGIEEGTVWTQEKADAALASKVAGLSKAITKGITGPTRQGQFDAFISLSYNIGLYALLTSTAFKQHNKGLLKDAAIAITWWNKITVNGVKVYSAGLNRRRLAEKALYMEVE